MAEQHITTQRTITLDDSVYVKDNTNIKAPILHSTDEPLTWLADFKRVAEGNGFQAAFKDWIQNPWYVQQAHAELNQFQMDPNKPLVSYNEVMELLFDRAKITHDGEKAKYYLWKLTKDFRDYLYVHKEPQDLADLTKLRIYAKDFEERRLNNVFEQCTSKGYQETERSERPAYKEPAMTTAAPRRTTFASSNAEANPIAELTKKIERLSKRIIELEDKRSKNN
ncbi:hypothetical protein BGZ76_002388, partial [Entomortierella beljakovae]